MLSWSATGGGQRAAGGSVFIIHCLVKAMNRRNIVRSVEAREYFFTYNYYQALTLKKYARIFDSRVFFFLFHSFAL
jgi:hypothetical protein